MVSCAFNRICFQNNRIQFRIGTQDNIIAKINRRQRPRCNLFYKSIIGVFNISMYLSKEPYFLLAVNLELGLLFESVVEGLTFLQYLIISFSISQNRILNMCIKIGVGIIHLVADTNSVFLFNYSIIFCRQIFNLDCNYVIVKRFVYTKF